MMLAFLTGTIFQLYFKYFVFLTQIRKKYTMFVILAKNKVIYEAESTNMWILADEACFY